MGICRENAPMSYGNVEPDQKVHTYASFFVLFYTECAKMKIDDFVSSVPSNEAAHYHRVNQSAKGTEMTDSMKTRQKSDFL